MTWKNKTIDILAAARNYLKGKTLDVEGFSCSLQLILLCIEITVYKTRENSIEDKNDAFDNSFATRS